MQLIKTRRKRKRRPTLTPRFGPASVALELGLIRESLQTTNKTKKISKSRASKSSLNE